MLDALIRRYTSPLLAGPVSSIAAFGIGADALTTTGFVVGIAALPAIGRRAYLLGLGLIALSRILDAIGSALARLTSPRRSGIYLERVLELIWTASVPFAFALAEPERALAAMFLMLGLVARAAAMSDDIKLGHGSLLVGAGLLGKSETFVAYALACLFPAWFSIIAYILGIACFVMTGVRVAASEIQRP
jgi:hypothetical protein